MNDQPKKLSQTEQKELNERLAPVYRRIGGLTFFVGLAAILLGLWIDKTFDTQPIFTIGLIAFSAPIVIWLNTRMIKRQIDQVVKEIRNKK